MKRFHPYIVFGLILCGAIFAPHCFAEDAAPIMPTGHVELFNGKDFAGWAFCMRTNAPTENTWAVTNGLIHCTGRPNGFVRTQQAYRDYKVHVEWRFVKAPPRADNTGVMVHMQLPDAVWPRTIECQGMHDKQGEFWMQGGATCKGHDTQATRHVTTAEPSNEKPVGEWNVFEAECKGDNIKVYVNGKLMNEAAECNVSAGFIGLQSEGAEIEVRKVSLDPLKS
jgi:hypothetical protein